MLYPIRINLANQTKGILAIRFASRLRWFQRRGRRAWQSGLVDEAWFGLIGAALGVTGLLGSNALVSWQTARGEEKRWARERRAAREDLQTQHWETKRRQVYMKFLMQLSGLEAEIQRVSNSTPRRISDKEPKDLDAAVKEIAKACAFYMPLLETQLPQIEMVGTSEAVSASRTAHQQHVLLMYRANYTVDKNFHTNLSRANVSILRFLDVARADLGVIANVQVLLDAEPEGQRAKLRRSITPDFLRD